MLQEYVVIDHSSIIRIKSNDKKFETNKYDIISNCYENKIPSGLTNEIVNGKILIKTFKKITKKSQNI